MLSVKVRISGDKEAIEGLKKLGQSLVMFKEAMGSIGKELKDFYGNQVMDSEGSIIDEKWPELSDRYALYKATGHTTLDPARMRNTSGKSIYPGVGILVRTGEMKKSFGYEAQEKSVTIYNDSDHFAFHNSDEARTSNLPQRKVFKVTDDVRDIISHIIDEDIKKKITKAGL